MKKFISFMLVLYLFIPVSVFAYSDYVMASGKNIGIALKSDYVLVVGSYDINNHNILYESELQIGDKIKEVKAKLEDGSLQVFDTSTFTVDGKKLDSYKADVDTDDKYTPDTEVIEDGAFKESKFRSAPYFDVKIDGIKLLNEKM